MAKPILSGVMIEPGVYHRHPGTPSWKCPLCKKFFQKKVHCQVHILNVHGKG